MEDEAIISMEKKEPERLVRVVPKLNKPVVVGKIDLDAINARTKPTKKSKEKVRKDAEERESLRKEKQKILKEARRAKRKAEQEKVNKNKTRKIEQEKQNKSAKGQNLFSIFRRWLNKLIGR